DLVGLVDLGSLQIGGDSALADTLGDGAALRLEHAVLVIIVQRGTHRVGKPDHHVFVVLLETHGDAGKPAAGADRADEPIDLAAELLPNLLRRRLDMSLAVGDIVELIGPDRAVRLARGKLFGETARIFYVVVRVLVGN